MCDNIKALLAKAWKNEAIELAPGTHNIDEVLMVRVEWPCSQGKRYPVQSHCLDPADIDVGALLGKKRCHKRPSLADAQGVNL